MWRIGRENIHKNIPTKQRLGVPLYQEYIGDVWENDVCVFELLITEIHSNSTNIIAVTIILKAYQTVLTERCIDKYGQTPFPCCIKSDTGLWKMCLPCPCVFAIYSSLHILVINCLDMDINNWWNFVLHEARTKLNLWNWRRRKRILNGHLVILIKYMRHYV